MIPIKCGTCTVDHVLVGTVLSGGVRERPERLAEGQLPGVCIDLEC